MINGNEVFKVPLGYIRLNEVNNSLTTFELLTYGDADLDDPDNAAEAVMSAKAQPLSLRVTNQGFTHQGAPFEYILSSGEAFISKHKTYEDAIKAVLELSPLDWIAVDEVGEKH